MNSIRTQNINGMYTSITDGINENVIDFSYEFDFGKTYVLDSEIGGGGWAISWILGGRLKADSGKIYWNDNISTQAELRQNSWLVRGDEIKRFGIFNLSVKSQIRSGIRKTGNPTQFEDQIFKAFSLTPERYNRPLSQLSSEAWRASCAIGFAHGKKIFCFPHMDYFHPSFIREYRSLWFEEILQFLKSSGALVIYPTKFTKEHYGLFDQIVKLPNLQQE